MASPRQSWQQEAQSDGFEAYVTVTLREATKMLAAEHQRLVHLQNHARRSAAEETLERKRARAMVKRVRSDNNDDTSHGRLALLDRKNADEHPDRVHRVTPPSLRTTFLESDSRFSDSIPRRSLQPDDASSVCHASADTWTESLSVLQGEITPSRGSVQSNNRSSLGSMESELVQLNGFQQEITGVTPIIAGPRISIVGVDRTSLHSIGSAKLAFHSEGANNNRGIANNRISVDSMRDGFGQRMSAESDVSGISGAYGPKRTLSNQLTSKFSENLGKMLGWMPAPSVGSATGSSTPRPGSNRSSLVAAPGGLKKAHTSPTKSKGLTTLFSRKTSKTAEPNSRSVSFVQPTKSEEEVETSEVSSLKSEDGDDAVQLPEQVEPLPPAPIGQLVTEEKVPADVHPAAAQENGKTSASQEVARKSRASQDASSMRSESLSDLDEEAEIMRMISRQTASREPSRRSDLIVNPSDSLMLRVAKETSRGASKSPAHSLRIDPQQGQGKTDGEPWTEPVNNRFNMLEIWMEKRGSTQGFGALARGSMGALSSDDILKDIGEYEESKFDDGKNKYLRLLKRAWFTPNMKVRLAWDLVASFLVVYECIMIPLMFIGLEPPWSNSLSWIVRIFWTLDMPLSFVTGYVLSDGTHEMRLPKVATRYLSTWFFVDLLVLVTDWSEVLFDDVSYAGAARAGKTAKTIRLLRMARIARLFKFKKLKTPEIFELFMETIFSPELLPVVFNVFKIVCIFAWINHVMACLWYSLGDAAFGEMNWIKGHLMDHMPDEYIYMSAFHWSLQQFAGAAEVWPWNMEERTFAVVFGVITFVVAGAFVSSLTSSMTHFEIINSQDSKRLTQLKHFLFDSGISHAVAMRVQRNAKHALKEEKRNMPESQIELLPKLSEPLRMEIHYDMHMSSLASHPFFRLYNEISPFMMRNVCHNACLDLKLSPGDVLFCEGEVPKDPHVFFVKHGCMKYKHHSGYSEITGPGKWASEAGVWCTWIHCGSMVALEECTLLVLVAPQFQSVCSHFLKEIEYARQYGRAFLKHLNNTEESELTDLEDPEMDIEWIAMQTCPHYYKQAGLVGRLIRRSSRTQALQRSSTMKLLRKGFSNSNLQSKQTEVTETSQRDVAVMSLSAKAFREKELARSPQDEPTPNSPSSPAPVLPSSS